jgi:hypothetical protein
VSRFLPRLWKRTLTPGSSPDATLPPAVVGINAQGAAWLARSAAGVGHWHYLAWPNATPQQALDQLQGQLQKHSAPSDPLHTRLVLAPSLVRHWLQTPPAQVASLKELRSVALARCSQLFGTPASNGTVNATWSVSADWHARSPFVCAALASDWANACAQKQARAQVTQDLVALVTQQYQRHLPRDGWLALVVAHTLYLLQFERKRIVGLRSMRMPAGADAMQLQHAAFEEWTREMLRTQTQTPILHWLCPIPHGERIALLPDMRILPFSLALRVPLPPPSLSMEDTGGVDVEHVHEVLLTAWGAEHGLAGAAR